MYLEFNLFQFIEITIKIYLLTSFYHQIICCKGGGVGGGGNGMHFIYGGTLHVSSFAHFSHLLSPIFTHANVEERLRHGVHPPHFTSVCVSIKPM